ncbi:hypothetical protein GCM10011383_37540 [Hymenobacter cavernae]|uniref:DUF1963 domain-containing protein n=1 Tax=Hymenobacter cavernae TaxID=2044852 RepID=A0ABQ1UM82_9BACT|nr:hypothetical protein GCM10011383_37540 [Hymenobacter cavernae]
MMQPDVLNLTLSDATRHLPYLTYARCIDAADRPAQHSGDWPIAGDVYPVRLDETSQALHILCFEGFYPYYNLYAIQRFELLADVWLN